MQDQETSMAQERVEAAQAALRAATERERSEVLGWLAGERPESVLHALQAIREHAALVARLRRQPPPAQRSG